MNILYAPTTIPKRDASADQNMRTRKEGLWFVAVPKVRTYSTRTIQRVSSFGRVLTHLCCCCILDTVRSPNICYLDCNLFSF